MSNTQEQETVFRLAEAAEFLKVSERTLWQEATNGNVPSFRIGKQFRFLESELVAHAKQQAKGS